MMTQNTEKNRTQIQMFCIDDLVPQDHLLRIIDKAIDWTFIYDLVEDKYCQDNGRPSMDPVSLIKIPFIQNHGFRYTQMYGKARMKMKVALTFACMNLKKLAKMQQSWELRTV